jgi:hypothetical protein
VRPSRRPARDAAAAVALAVRLRASFCGLLSTRLAVPRCTQCAPSAAGHPQRRSLSQFAGDLVSASAACACSILRPLLAMRLMIQGQYNPTTLGTLARQSASEISALGPNCALLLECLVLAAASVDWHCPDGRRTRGVCICSRLRQGWYLAWRPRVCGSAVPFPRRLIPPILLSLEHLISNARQ